MTVDVSLIALVLTMVIGPTLTVECGSGFECEVRVYPNTYIEPLLLAVDAEYLLKWERIITPSYWGVRLWFEAPRCVGTVSRIRLLAEGETGTEIDRHVINSLCAFLPIVNK